MCVRFFVYFYVNTCNYALCKSATEYKVIAIDSVVQIRELFGLENIPLAIRIHAKSGMTVNLWF